MATFLRVLAYCGIAASWAATSAAQTAPEAWARRMAAAYDGRTAFEKIGDRSGKEGAKEALAQAYEALANSLSPLVGSANQNAKIELVLFVLEFDSLWKADAELDMNFLGLLTSRIDKMTPEHFTSWRAALRVFQSDVNDTAVVGLVARTDRLFDHTGFSALESWRLQRRLGAVQEASISALANTLVAAEADAVLRIAEADAFWDAQDKFKVEEFDKALTVLQAIRGK